MSALIVTLFTVSIWAEVASGQRLPEEKSWQAQSTSPAFVAACHPDRTATGEPFSDQTLLVLVHNPVPLHDLGHGADLCESQTVLYFIRDREDEGSWAGMAWQHWSRGETPWEAEGGMMSAALAEDYYNTVISQPFYYAKDWVKYIKTNKEFPTCNVRYRAIRYYIDQE